MVDAAAFVGRTIVVAAHRVRFALVRLAIHDPDAAAISFPAGNAGSEVLVGISDALVVFLFELVFVGVRIGIAPAPEFFDKALALVVSLRVS